MVRPIDMLFLILLAFIAAGLFYDIRLQRDTTRIQSALTAVLSNYQFDQNI